jgi:2-isopropylmalate synthase
MSQGSDAKAAAFVEAAIDNIPGIRYGVGINANIVTASVLAIISALNRSLNGIEPEAREETVEVLLNNVRQVA